MANLPEVSNFDSVYQIEITDPVQGGASGVTNTPLKNLTNRTKWLKDRADGLENLIGRKLFNDLGEITLSGSAFTFDAADVGILQIFNVTANSIVNLPAASTCDKSGYFIQVRSANNTNIILTRAGSDVIQYENQSRNSFPVFAGENLIIVSDGTSKWHVLADVRDQSPAGSIVAHAANTAPGGYLKANGAAVSRTIYARLFAAIGTTFGVGDGSTTFNLPDLRGEFIRGWDDGRGVDTGRVFGSAQVEGVNTAGVQLREGNLTFAATGAGVGSSQAYFENSNLASYGTNMTLFGDTETRPRNVALLYCIKF